MFVSSRNRNFCIPTSSIWFRMLSFSKMISVRRVICHRSSRNSILEQDVCGCGRKLNNLLSYDYKLHAPRAEIYIETNRIENKVEIISTCYIKAQMNFDERPSRRTKYSCLYCVYRVFISDVLISVARENLRVKSYERVESFFVLFFVSFSKTRPNHEIKMKSCLAHGKCITIIQQNIQKQKKKTPKLKLQLRCVSIRVGFPYAIIKVFS